MICHPAALDPMHLLLIALLCTALTLPAAAQGELQPSVTERAFDAQAFAGLTEQTEALADLRGLVVLRRGRVAFEFQRGGQARDALQPVESVTKSVLSLLVGIAVDQGRIASLDQPVLALLPQLADANDDPRAQRLTVRHLLTMTGGFEPSERRFFDAKERARFAMARRFEAEPGTTFRYDNPAANLLAALLEQAVGETPAAYAQRHLFAPLGIEASDWARDEQGHHLGFSGLQLRTRDLARIGQLMLQQGRWGGHRVVSENFVHAASTRRNGGGPPVGLTYGYLWWVAPSDAPRPPFVASGYGGQFIWVDPALELVIAASAEPTATGAARHQALDLIRLHIVPAVAKSQPAQPPAGGG
jgi:CubicO group peptidase (beta-lactamase class C family)